VKHFYTNRSGAKCRLNIYTNRSGAKCRLDIYHWGAGLAVTGRMHDIGQNVLQSSSETGSSSCPSYCQILLLIAFLDEVFVRNTIIRLLTYCTEQSPS